MKKKIHKIKWKQLRQIKSCFHLAGHVLYPQAQTNWHTHNDFIEISWCKSGRGIHEINGQRYEFHAHSLWLIRQTNKHNIVNETDTDFWFYNLAFPVQHLKQLCKRYETKILQDWLNNDLPGCMHYWISPTIQQWLCIHVDTLFHHKEQKFTLDYFLLNLLYMLEREENRELPNTVPKWLEQLLIKTNNPEYLQQGTSIFSKLSGYSREYIARMMKEQLGKTPTEILNEMRLQHAAMMLISTNKKISEIAYTCGIKSNSYFFQIFHQKYQVSPSQYRKQNSRPVNV